MAPAFHIQHANATGHYAGHPDPAPDLVDEIPQQTGARKGLLSAFPRTKYEETWLRGALPSDANGVAEFTSIFPGYYTGRATHVHVKVHPEWTMLPNGTFQSGRLIHTGQFFVDDELNEQIDKLWPYNTNPIRDLPGRGRTRNWDDSLKIYQESHENGYMPTFDIEPLGGVLSQGLIGYITMVSGPVTLTRRAVNQGPCKWRLKLTLLGLSAHTGREHLCELRRRLVAQHRQGRSQELINALFTA